MILESDFITNKIKIFNLSLQLLFLCSCTNIFLRPDAIDYTKNWEQRDQFVKASELATSMGPIKYWLLGYKIQKPKGIVLQFHGNAENMTSHAMNVGWLTEHGYQVIAFDYPGYGQTPGKANIKNALMSSHEMMKFTEKKAKDLNIPYFFYGQSLGGSLLMKELKDHPKDFQPNLVIVESSFFSYPDIAQDKMSEFWLLWPFQWMAQIFVSSKYDPGGEDLKAISHLNYLFIHSEKDPIVPFTDSVRFVKALDSKTVELWTLPEPSHIAMAYLDKGKYRESFLTKLKASIKNPRIN